MEFSFRIRNALRESVALFKKHLWFFVGVAAVTVVLNLAGSGKHTPWVVVLILTIATFVWSIVMMKFSLAAADNKEELLSFSQVRAMLPSGKQALGVIGVGLLGGLITIAGFVLLIIPGIWIAFRLSLASFVYIDRGEGIRKSLRTSYNLTKGHAFWTTVLVCLVAGGLYLVGFILLGVGILFTYPVAMIFMAKFYRALTVHHGHAAPVTAEAASVVVQAEEIPAHTETSHQ
jgi:uncharacterized membrane protein